MQKTFNSDFDTVYKCCRSVVKQLKFTIESSSASNGYIKARSGTSLLSWGEEIVIHIDEISRNKTKVVVKSESSQLITWGKNEGNEEDIIDLLIEKLE